MAVTVLDAILGHAASDPGHPAVRDPDVALGYGELAERARSVAGGLLAAGVEPGDRVAIHLPNCVDFVVAALGCLSARAAFVPLAATDPTPRLSAILDDCRPAVVVVPDTGGWPGELTAAHRATTVDELLVSGAQPPEDLASEPEDLAYIIYTSGTTGTPKGVCIPQGSFVAAVRSAVSGSRLDAATRALSVSPFHFDGSFGTLFPTLAAGGSLLILPRDRLLFPRTFFNAVVNEKITFTSFSPSYLRLLLGDRRRTMLADSALGAVALGGEACTVADITALWELVPGLRVINRYGPTETTIAVTHCELSPERIADGRVPIGRPHPGVDFHLVGEDGEPVGADEVGELYIGGDQLMAGYWNAPALTAAALRTDIVDGRTVYRTGDLVVRNSAGDYVYVDRADRVIKRSGVRISLVELTEVVGGLPGVAAATCCAYDADGQLGIAAFVVPDDGPARPAVRQLAAERLPATMLPDRVVFVDELPLARSSKLDERRLLADAGLSAPRRA